MAPSVFLPSGQEVNVNPANFEGTGADLREAVACELRLSPPRLTLITDANHVIELEETLSSSDLGLITVTVGEGTELAEFCKKWMADFVEDVQVDSEPAEAATAGTAPKEEEKIWEAKARKTFTMREVSGVGTLPESSEEMLPKDVGKALTFAIRRAQKRSLKQLQTRLKDLGHRAYAACDLEDWDCPEDYSDLPDQVRELVDSTLFGISANEDFEALDRQLRGPNKLCFYSRWEQHAKANGEPGQHRVYGIRQAYSAIEIDQVCGQWCEEQGSLSRVAMIRAVSAWSDKMGSARRIVERTTSPEKTVLRLKLLSDILMAASGGKEDASWAIPYMKDAFLGMMKGLECELYSFRAGCYELNAREETEKDTAKADSVRLLHEILGLLRQNSRIVEGGHEEFVKALIGISEERDLSLRGLGIALLTTFGQGEPEVHEALNRLAQNDWPYVRAAARESLAKEGEDVTPRAVALDLENFHCPSPRTLLNQSLNNNVLRLTRRRKLMRKRKKGKQNPAAEEGDGIMFDYASGCSDDEEE